MLLARPIRLPYMKRGVAAVSLQDADSKELCVPAALYNWLINQTTDGKGGKRSFMTASACTKYPNALPIVKLANGRVPKKVKITLENVTALLDAIHCKNCNADMGHTVTDVEEFVSLFNCDMVALNRDGIVIGSVMDGSAHHPLCFTCAHGHMYWHCQLEDIKSITETAKQQRMLGSKHFCAQGGSLAANVSKKTQESDFLIVDEDHLCEIFENPRSDNAPVKDTVYLVKGAKDLESLFKKYGWIYGEPWAKIRDRRVVRFGVRFGSRSDDRCDLTIGADPFYEQVLLSIRKNTEFDHRALFDACAENNIAINPLDGMGNVNRQILRPRRARMTLEIRQGLFDKQTGTCAKCDFRWRNER